MAKKSTAGHHKSASAHGKGVARKPQAPERPSAALLVRAPGAKTSETTTPSAANVVAEPKPLAPKPAPAPKPVAAAKPAEKKVATAEKPTAPATPATPATRPAAVPSREQNMRLARARATQRAREANLISAESYSYVLGDLKLVVALAVTAFVALIALTFVLPH